MVPSSSTFWEDQEEEGETFLVGVLVRAEVRLPGVSALASLVSFSNCTDFGDLEGLELEGEALGEEEGEEGE
jgi:hypothetical protein